MKKIAVLCTNKEEWTKVLQYCPVKQDYRPDFPYTNPTDDTEEWIGCADEEFCLEEGFELVSFSDFMDRLDKEETADGYNGVNLKQISPARVW